MSFASILTLAASLAVLPRVARADDGAILSAIKGDVKVRQPSAKAYEAAKAGIPLVEGARLKTEEGGEARVQYPDGSVAEIKSKSEVLIHVSANPEQRPSGVALFFGRVWSKVAKSASGTTKYEVESANAVAGVRGTEFDVGVGMDGSVRVMVDDGEVAVEGDEGGKASVKKGSAVESEQGKLGKVGKRPEDPNWDGWFTECARRMEKTGLKVAKSLDGRLNRRKQQVEKLVKEQRQLRQKIEKLEARKKQGDEVDGELRSSLAELTRVTARLESMKARLEGAFSMFQRWGQEADRGMMGGDSGAMKGMASNIQKIAADYADMIEEGTDTSEEGMNEMMHDMQKGKSDRPKQNAGDELFH